MKFFVTLIKTVLLVAGVSLICRGYVKDDTLLNVVGGGFLGFFVSMLED